MEAYVDGGGGGARGLRYQPETMVKFKQGIDELIKMLTESPAGSKNMAADPVTRRQFGGGEAAWTEAHGVFDAYETVLNRLVQLSSLLGDCLEGMGIAVVMSKNGLERTDDDIKSRMREIAIRAEEAEAEARREAAANARRGTRPGPALKGEATLDD
ncbi:hypothetical protein [Streptomyces fradiae]|uniref:hypothetical protein n=1 Tax=Streptomyces fradiae TaxID=1906 RepID=UPI0035113182